MKIPNARLEQVLGEVEEELFHKPKGSVLMKWFPPLGGTILVCTLIAGVLYGYWAF